MNAFTERQDKQQTLVRIIMALPLCATKKQALTQTVPFVEDIVKAACFIAGGCTLLDGKGYWVLGAEKTQEVYLNENIVEERAVVIEIVVSSHKVPTTIKHLKRSIVSVAQRYSIDMDWVHITTSWVQTHHFSIAEDTPA